MCSFHCLSTQASQPSLLMAAKLSNVLNLITPGFSFSILHGNAGHCEQRVSSFEWQACAACPRFGRGFSLKTSRRYGSMSRSRKETPVSPYRTSCILLLDTKAYIFPRGCQVNEGKLDIETNRGIFYR